MKNFIFTFALLSALFFSSFTLNKTTTVDDNFTFNCDSVIFDAENNMLELIGNVYFKTDILELESVEKVIVDKTCGDVIAIHPLRYSIKGAVEIQNAGKENILYYTIGENTAFLN